MTGSTAPALGERYDPYGAHLADPYPFFRMAREHEPVFYSPSLDTWFVTTYEDVVAILKDPGTFSSKATVPGLDEFPAEVQAVLNEGLVPYPPLQPINSEGPAHARLKMLVGQGFTVKAVQSYAPWVQEICDELVASLRGRETFDLIESFAYPLPLSVVLRVLGVPPEDLGKCRSWAHDYATLHWASRTDVDRLVGAAQRVVAFQQYVAELVDRKQAQPSEDLLSRLIHAQIRDNASLSRDELVSIVPGLILAGHETTAGLIGNVTYALIASGRWSEAAARSDDESVAALVEEALRFDTSALGLRRVTTRPTRVRDVELPEGARVLLLFSSANHDEAKFCQPETFDPERDNASDHLAFGKGIHQCAGARLARLELRIALQGLFHAFPRLTLAGESEPERLPSLVLHSFAGLRLAVAPA